MTHVFGWKNTPERAALYGRACRILVVAKRMGSVLVEFEDGLRHVVSRRALRKRKEAARVP